VVTFAALDQMEAGPGRGVGGAAFGVDDPNILDSEAKVVVQLFHRGGKTVLLIEDLDHRQRRIGEYLFTRTASLDHT